VSLWVLSFGGTSWNFFFKNCCCLELGLRGAEPWHDELLVGSAQNEQTLHLCKVWEVMFAFQTLLALVHKGITRVLASM